MRYSAALAILAMTVTATPAAIAGTVPVANAYTLAPLVKEVTPAVVNIRTRTLEPAVENPLFQDPFFRQFFNIPRNYQPQPQVAAAAGSGVIIDAKRGYILTNNHVVAGAQRIEVTTKDGRTYRAKLIGRDAATDIAVLKIDAHHLKSIPLGDSNKVAVGDYVLAIGNPFALGQTVTSGIVSAVGRSGLGIEGYEDFIQTDASINPGNSGGALVNFKGQLIGINTAIVAPSGGNVGIGFAIPINMARAVMDQIITHGKVSRGHIGVEIQNLTPELARALHDRGARGAAIVSVMAGSPAQKAGLKSGDVVVQVDGAPVTSAAQLRDQVALTPVGQQVALTVLHDDRQRVVKVTIAPGTEVQPHPSLAQ
jgi:serine protease DegQ